MIKNFILINPPWQSPKSKRFLPLGLGYIGISIKENTNYNVKIVDFNIFDLSEKDIIQYTVDYVKSLNPNIIGLSISVVNFPFVFEFIRNFYERFKQIPIILGGHYASLNYIWILENYPYIDYIVIGEGENTIIELLNEFEKKEPNFNKIKGISYRDKNDNLIFTGTRKKMSQEELSNLSYNYISLFPPLESYQIDKYNKNYSIIASRGCPFRCDFCSSFQVWGDIRYRSVESIIKEIKFIKKKYKINTFRFEDDNLLWNKYWRLTFLEAITKLQIKWICNSRLDLIKPEEVPLLKLSGLSYIYHGIESGSKKVREMLGKRYPKNFTNEKIYELVSIELKNDIIPELSFMIGHPKEKKQDILETFHFMRELKKIGANLQLWILTPYRGTLIRQKYDNLLLKFNRWNEMKQADVFYEYQRHLYRGFYLKYYNYSPDEFIFKNHELSIEELKNLYETGIKIINDEIFFY